MVDSKIPIDTEFDFRQEVGDRDPDIYSPTLKQFHQILWNKTLPNGKSLQITNAKSKYLVGICEDKSIYLSSDSIVHSYWGKARMNKVLIGLDVEVERFRKVNSTIGGYILFPGNQIDGKWTINQARGCHQKIADRFDLTLECIRLHYLNVSHPLDKTLKRYSNFFNLFNDFTGYIKFFLLDDLVDENYSTVKFHTNFEQLFISKPLPQNQSEYRIYAENSKRFVKLRNERIRRWVSDPSNQLDLLP